MLDCNSVPAEIRVTPRAESVPNPLSQPLLLDCPCLPPQLFSKLDLVVWDTAARMEAQACPGNTGSARGSALVARAAEQQAITAHVTGTQQATADSGTQQRYQSAVMEARGAALHAHRRSRGAHHRKLLLSGAAAKELVRYAQRAAAEALRTTMGPQLASQLTARHSWNVTSVMEQQLLQRQQGVVAVGGEKARDGPGQQQQQPAGGRVCAEMEAAAWGSVTGTCGWVGISRWAATLQAQGQLK